jgi:hypothetical protein
MRCVRTKRYDDARLEREREAPERGTTRRVFLAAGALVPMGAVMACAPVAIPAPGVSARAAASAPGVASATAADEGAPEDPLEALRAAQIGNEVDPASVFRAHVGRAR